MSWNNNFKERRKYPRYYPDKKNLPRVTFLLNGSPKISITTINISKGGLMGYTSSIEDFLTMEDHYIKLIEVCFPNKKPFRCAGRILRLQPSFNENRCYCAIEFEMQHLNDFADGDLIYSEEERFRRKIPDKKFLERIESIHNYMDIEDIDEETKFRRKAYNAFDDITEYLTIEEKWLFYEILDEMVSTAPNYPDNLRKAFISLCHTGIKQTLHVKNDIRKIPVTTV